MGFGQRLRLGMLVFAALGVAGSALAGDRAPIMSVAGGGKTLADDKCVAQCDGTTASTFPMTPGAERRPFG